MNVSVKAGQSHKDQVDASSGAFNMLATPSGFSWTEDDFCTYAADNLGLGLPPRGSRGS
jgi:hypothetical protein